MLCKTRQCSLKKPLFSLIISDFMRMNWDTQKFIKLRFLEQRTARKVKMYVAKLSILLFQAHLRVGDTLFINGNNSSGVSLLRSWLTVLPEASRILALEGTRPEVAGGASVQNVGGASQNSFKLKWSLLLLFPWMECQTFTSQFFRNELQ